MAYDFLANLGTPRVDWGVLGDIGKTIGDAREQGALSNDLKAAVNPDGSIDVNKAAVILMKYNPEAAVTLAANQANTAALTNYRVGQLGIGQANEEPAAIKIMKAYQNGELGPPPPPAQPVTAPQPMNLGPADSGVSAPTGTAGASYTVPSNVPSMASGLQNIDPQLARAPAAVQDVALPAQDKEALVKQADLAVKRQDEEPADWALVNSYNENGNLILGGIKQLFDEKGRPNEGLTALTGNHVMNGVQTPIPNSYLPNISQPARDTAATLSGIKTQIGLLQLAAMRAASKQGASGMGQLAIQESLWLQQAVRNLDDSQGTPQFARNLIEVGKHVQRLQAALEYKYKKAHGKPYMPMPDQGDQAPIVGAQPSMDMGTEPQVSPTDQQQLNQFTAPGANPRGSYNGPYPDGTRITNGKTRLIMQGGQWVPYQ